MILFGSSDNKLAQSETSSESDDQQGKQKQASYAKASRMSDYA